jgi:dolichol kinase
MLPQIERGVREVLPEVGHEHRLRFLPLAILGAVLSLSRHPDRIVVPLAFAARVETMLQRLRRWLMRETFVVEEVLTGWVRE